MEQTPEQQEKKQTPSSSVLRPARPFMSRLPGIIAVTVATTTGVGGALDAEAGNNRNNLMAGLAGVMAISNAMSGDAMASNRLEIKKPDEFVVTFGNRAEETMRNLKLTYDSVTQKISRPNGERIAFEKPGRKVISVDVRGLSPNQLQMECVYSDQLGTFSQKSYAIVDAFQHLKVFEEMSTRIR